ncbi:MAG: hypothetical protein Q9178_000221 [Gyalolechia marmorata]
MLENHEVVTVEESSTPIKSTPHVGQEAPKESRFCPLAAVNKWPYKFFHHVDSETISKAFFAAGKFRTRGWTLYYIHTLLNNASKPLILVPAAEVQALFDDIKKELRLLVYFPHEEQEPGFLLSFTEEGSPRPRYLGRFDLQHSLDDMEAKIPPYTYEDNGEQRTGDRSFAAFKKKMEAAIEATKQKSKHQRDRKKKERIGTKQAWCEQLKRAQCYLGVRPRMKEPSMPNPMQDPSIPPRELERAMRKYQISRGLELPDLIVSEPAPFAFEDKVVFICVDVEAYEKDNRPITEIGISTLDTNDLDGLPPGECGKAWMRKIRARHFRIKETAHLHNSEYVAGCADSFEPDFGVSEWISFKEAPQVIASCFRPPYSHPFDHVRSDSPTVINGTDAPKRRLILVGHDIKMDIDYLRKLGYDVSNLSNLIEALDTADLHRAWKHHQNPSKLGTVLMEMEMVGWNLHNAGNDAAYTLQALIGIAIASRQSSLATTQSQIAHRTQVLEREARDRAKEEAEEWAAADIEGGDGGPPKPLERFGWPDKPHTSKIINSKDRRAKRIATETHAQSQSAKKIEATQLKGPEMEIKTEPWVAEEEDVGSFAQSITERLAFLEEDGEQGGGVKLPAVMEMSAVPW